MKNSCPGTWIFLRYDPNSPRAFLPWSRKFRPGMTSAPYLKGQIVGPVTMGLGLKDERDRLLIHDPELLDAVIKGLAGQGLSQMEHLAALGKKTLLFIDEPSLSGYGSAFTPLSRSEVLDILGETIRLIREKSDALIGLHCCGNTDWSLLLSLDLDLINLDAFAYGEAFLLYPREIRTFLEQDRAIAWGIVPTLGLYRPGDGGGLAGATERVFRILDPPGDRPGPAALPGPLDPGLRVGDIG